MIRVSHVTVTSPPRAAGSTFFRVSVFEVTSSVTVTVTSGLTRTPGLRLGPRRRAREDF